MNEGPAAIRSETLALDALIQETIAQAEASTGQGPADRMLFLGNRHQSFPTAVIKDSVLEPVDKLVWMVIMLSVHETGGNTAFPGYEAIGKMVNVSSRSTIARAIAVLRATRWLTLCARLRKTSGRFRGVVYALHDEPAPLVDALHLDADYMSFLDHSLSHGHARVRTVAQAVLDSMDEDIQAGQAVCAQTHPIERRIQSTVATKDGQPRRFFSLEDDEPLVYPARLCDNHREMAARYLSALVPDQRQPVLDELEGRFQAEKKGMKPVYDEIRFLHSLCKLMRQGKFQPNLGIKVRNRRREREKASTEGFPSRLPQATRETDEQRRQRRASSLKHITEIRKRCGMKSPTKNQDVTGES